MTRLARSIRSAVLRPSQDRTDSTTSRNCPPISWVRIRSNTARPRARCSARQAGGGEQLLGPVEAEVSGEDRPGDAEAVGVARPGLVGVPGGERPVRGRLAAAGVAVVHDVVVDQGRRLEELHRRREADQGGGVRLAGGAVAPVQEGGPQPLAAREQRPHGGEQLLRVGADLGQHPGLGRELGVDALLHAGAQAGGVERVAHLRLLVRWVLGGVGRTVSGCVDPSLT